ncbi:MAG: transcription antitermination factor NusB [Bryobacteraceae bacterium]
MTEIDRRISPARTAAFDVLRQVEAGEFATDALRVRTAALSSRDAGLATELAMGCLRYQPQLDWIVKRCSSRPLDRLDPEVLLSLRLAIYQIRHLDRVPAHAAVDESVELVKWAGKRSAAPFVNAVLRRVKRTEVPWQDAAMEFCLPPWLWQRWCAEFGEQAAERIATASLVPAETYIRVPAGREQEAESLLVEKTPVDGCYRLTGPDPGPFRIQDIGSQTIVPLLDLQPGCRFLDVAAAPGNKTAQALEIPVRAVACDASVRRLAEMPQLHCPVVAARGESLPFGPVFDRVLVDAPCSGTGTIRRNPEIKWRVTDKEVSRHAARQRELLRAALRVLVPGGRLVYSTCSLERAENEAVVQQVMGETAGAARVVDTMRRLPGEHPGDGFFAAVITLEKPLST